MQKTTAHLNKIFTHKFFIGIIISLFACIFVLFSYSSVGITWDEPYYIQSGIHYIEWLQHPTLNSIDTVWGLTDKHPPFGKIPGGISYHVFHQTFNVFEPLTAFRVGGLCFVFLLTLSVFLFTQKFTNTVTALLTVFFLTTFPRLFFEAHLATLDYPLATFWLLSVLAYLKGVQNNKWLFISSTLLGLTLLIKLSAVFLMGSLIIYGILVPILKQRTINRSVIKHLLRNTLPLILIPSIIYFSLWPWLWNNTYSKLLEYLSFHVNHFIIPVFYNGSIYKYAPWHYPFVFTAITTPLYILFFFFLGCLYIGKYKRLPELIFVLFQAIFPLFILAQPSVPKYDGIRNFLPAFPFIFIVFGFGLFYLQQIFYHAKFKIVYFFIITILVSYAILTVFRTHPYYSMYYNEISFFVNIPEKFEMDYFGQSYKQILPTLSVLPKTSIWVPFATDAFLYYQSQGKIHKDTKISYDCPECTYLVLLHRKGLISVDPRLQSIIETHIPYHTLMFNNFPIILIYKL